MELGTDYIGIQTTVKIRSYLKEKMPRAQQPMIICMVNQSHNRKEEGNCREAGMDDFVSKPIFK